MQPAENQTAQKQSSVTYLTNPEQKAALEAFAKARGESVGNVVREATAQYIEQPTPEELAELARLVEQVNEAIPAMNTSLDTMIATVRDMRRNIRDTLSQLDTRP